MATAVGGRKEGENWALTGQSTERGHAATACPGMAMRINSSCVRISPVREEQNHIQHLESIVACISSKERAAWHLSASERWALPEVIGTPSMPKYI